MSEFASVEQLAEAIGRGEMVIIVDDADRENEGDLILAAEKVTPEKIGFMLRHTSGIICVPMLGERLDELKLPMMVSRNTAEFRTAFTVSVDAAEGVTTGISAADRARTIQVLVDPEATPADLAAIPGVIRQVPEEVALALALIENIQRENLNPVEEALALKRLLDEFELTQQQVADAVGKSRAQVANLLRLLALDPEVQTLLERGDLDMGHARALLALPGSRQRRTAQEVVDKDLTVRATEALVKRVMQGKDKPGEAARRPDVARLETRLGELLGATVKIHHGRSGKGRVTIRYSSLDELDGILEHIR